MFFSSVCPTVEVEVVFALMDMKALLRDVSNNETQITVILCIYQKIFVDIFFQYSSKEKGFMANEKWSSYHQGFVVSGSTKNKFE